MSDKLIKYILLVVLALVLISRLDRVIAIWENQTRANIIIEACRNKSGEFNGGTLTCD